MTDFQTYLLWLVGFIALAVAAAAIEVERIRKRTDEILGLLRREMLDRSGR